jgi:predicted alternative tryptophan synthase beta-subunit
MAEQARYLIGEGTNILPLGNLPAGLEQYLKTPARIYYKFEGVSPPGSHKPNTAVAQAYYNMKEGIERLTTETGAGQWGSALAFATMLFGLKCTIYMVRASYNQKPYRAMLCRTTPTTGRSCSTRTEYRKSGTTSFPTSQPPFLHRSIRRRGSR